MMDRATLFRSFLSGIPPEASQVVSLSGSSLPLFLSLQHEPFIAIEQTEEKALRLYEDILFFLSLSHGPQKGIYFLPDPGGVESSGARNEVIHKIGAADSIVTSLDSIKNPVWNPEELTRNSLELTTGQEVERDSIEERLTAMGYRRVSVVMEKGEYSSRRWLLDVFPPTVQDPFRVEFFGDEIEQIKTFDLDSQKSLQRLDSMHLLPVSTPPLDSAVTSLGSRRLFSIDIQKEALHDGMTCTMLSRYDFKGEGTEAPVRSMRGLGIYPEERTSLHDIAPAVARLRREHKVIIVSSSEGQADRVKDILFEGGIIAPLVKTSDLSTDTGSIAITKGSLSSGCFTPDLIILTEKEIFGERQKYRSLKRSKVSHLLMTLDDLAPGDFVVHKDHGIGRFVNIEKHLVGDSFSDLITLEYAGGDRLYIPVHSIERVKKYAAEEGILPTLDRLGGKTWHRRKERVRKAVREMAEKLLNLYAERHIAKSFSFSHDSELHREFYEFFPYEETADQIQSFGEISGDMESERPMDRLLCGDVGYGKTEVAMRAAFKAVFDGKQVAVLVPTTILCEQHSQTFKNRFSAFPVRIDSLSRFRSQREQEQTRISLARGETDIIIGTHTLLRKGISFNDLGLLIIDEEHRFGVGQKEKIKEIKKGIDVLSMTATPIPRTLQMALSGIRGMSVIETPPEERIAVKSVVSVFDEALIKEAIERELRRDGQVLFVHNAVYDIEKIAEWLRRLLPETRFAVAHGQMPEGKLEKVMLRFIEKEIDVLVSTTIIGSGIDIPSANTIIIDRADKIGLSDLYQLRGRVGRSDVKAFAFFLIPGMNQITEEARKRLQAIVEMSYLGAGVRLAMKDLEIRGAGNLLGPQQSGHIHAVGFDLYVEMLEKAVAELQGAPVQEEMETTVSLNVAASIPEGYIEDLTIRLSIYRRIANAKEDHDLEALRTEIADRFGPLPEEVKMLLEIMKLRLSARKLRISSISEADKKIRLVFMKDTPVMPEKVLSLQDTFKGIRFHKDGFELSTTGLSGDGSRKMLHQLLSSIQA